MDRDEIIAIHDAIDREEPLTYVTAANLILGRAGQSCNKVPVAVAVLQAALYALLDASKYTEAALLCWGTNLFDPRPRSVRLIWKALSTKSKILCLGAGSLGKSYTAIVWALLSWVRDPAFTTIKLVSTTFGHARSNTFSTLTRFHKESAIPLPGFVQAGFIGLTTEDKHSAITLVAIPIGDDGKGRLQGFHPLPRPQPHPLFGPLSRVILIIDEAEDAPTGLWQGVGNMLGNEDVQGSVTVYAATNPKRKESSFGQRAEPVDGWDSVDIETSESWISRFGYYVLRLDGAKCENVVEQRVVYSGLLTYQGYQNFVKEGVNTANYFTFARGWYPEQGAAYSIVPSYITNDLRGVYTFSRVIANCASFDPAFAEGGDDAVLTAGKYGVAIGFQPYGNLKPYEDFRDSPRYVVQAEQQFDVQKGRALDMTKDIVKILRGLKVRPEWFVMDMSGNARGLYDILSDEEVFGDILGVEWGEGATDRKILEEDSTVASDRYEGLASEMWFAFAAWAEFGFIKLASLISTSPLFTELIGRQYKQVGRTTQRVESKKDFKARNGGKSPDCFVAGTMIATPTGEVSIEQIKDGDAVLTPFGESVVVHCHRVETDKLATIQLKDGRILSGKPAHEIYVDGRWIPLGDICVDMMSESVQRRWTWIILNTLFTRIENSGFKSLVATIQTETRKRRRDFFTGVSGLTLTGVFLQTIVSITRTAIGWITDWRIWRFLLLERIQNIITTLRLKRFNADDEQALRRAGYLLPYGMVLQRVASGTDATDQTHGNTKRESASNALFVGKSFRHSLSSLALNALCPVGTSSNYQNQKWLRPVWGVGAILKSIVATLKKGDVVVRVRQSKVTPTAVYNLTLREENAFYANGILVSNCADSMIMLVHLIRERANSNAAVFERNREEPPADATAWDELRDQRMEGESTTSHRVKFVNTK